MSPEAACQFAPDAIAHQSSPGRAGPATIQPSLAEARLFGAVHPAIVRAIESLADELAATQAAVIDLQGRIDRLREPAGIPGEGEV